MNLFAKTLALSLLVVFLAPFYGTSQQEETPLKNFEYQISVDHLKTDTQAQKIADEINAIEGVENCSLILINYMLVFHTSNHALENADILSKVKEIVYRNNAQIVKINRKEE